MQTNNGDTAQEQKLAALIKQWKKRHNLPSKWDKTGWRYKETYVRDKVKNKKAYQKDLDENDCL